MNGLEFCLAVLPQIFCLELHTITEDGCMQCPPIPPFPLSNFENWAETVNSIPTQEAPKQRISRLAPLLSLLRGHLSESFHTTSTNRSRGRIQALARIKIASRCNSVTSIGSFHPRSVASDGLGEDTFSVDVSL